MRALPLSIASFLCAAFASSTALANPQIGAGYTGKPTASFPSGATCNDCHSGGTAPSITLTGPTTLAAGAKGDYTAMVSGGGNVKTFAAAATNGIAMSAGSNMGKVFDEVYGNNVNGGTVSFSFSITAPATSGDIDLWYVGLASNGANGKSGDRATAQTKTVTITGGTTPQKDGGTGTPGTDSGTSGGGDEDGGTTTGGTGGNGGTGGTGGNGGTGGTGSDGGTSGTDGLLPQNEDDGCSFAGGRAGSPAIAAFGVAVGLGLLGRRRRR